MNDSIDFGHSFGDGLRRAFDKPWRTVLVGSIAWLMVGSVVLVSYVAGNSVTTIIFHAVVGFAVVFVTLAATEVLTMYLEDQEEEAVTGDDE